MDMIERLARELQYAMEQVDILANDNKELGSRNDDLLFALRESNKLNSTLEEDIAELNEIHGTSPTTTDLAYINDLLQEATHTEQLEDPTPTVPISKTIDSVIARSLLLMDEGKTGRITVQDMITLQEFKYRWNADNEAKDTL